MPSTQILYSPLDSDYKSNEQSLALLDHSDYKSNEQSSLLLDIKEEVKFVPDMEQNNHSFEGDDIKRYSDSGSFINSLTPFWPKIDLLFICNVIVF